MTNWKKCIEHMPGDEVRLIIKKDDSTILTIKKGVDVNKHDPVNLAEYSWTNYTAQKWRKLNR